MSDPGGGGGDVKRFALCFFCYGQLTAGRLEVMVFEDWAHSLPPAAGCQLLADSWKGAPYEQGRLAKAGSRTS